MTPVNTIAVSGHRPGSLGPDSERHIRAGVRETVDQYPGATWLLGGAIGADQIATDELLRLGQRVELVLPFAPAIQGARWSRAQRRVLQDQVRAAAAVRVLRHRYHPAGYHERNRHLVERADLLLTFWNERHGGGTAATVRLAERCGVPIIVVRMP